jgi:hypothetical protein
MARRPSVSEARPRRCLGCAAASEPLGGRLVVHGDGTRTRQVRGPLTAQGPPEIVTIEARRYECQRCGACMVTLPREVASRRLYSYSAIGLALACWALLGASSSSVRARVCPFRIVGASAWSRWPTLRRWARAVRDGRLFATSRSPPAGRTWRQHAERAAQRLVASAPTSPRPLDEAAFVGAAFYRG